MNAIESSSTRPYLIRALYEWCTDNGLTPYVAVLVNDSVQVPRDYVKNGEIVLNISFDATSNLKLGNEYIEFRARFAGMARDIVVPIGQVIAIYARENGQGMAFPTPGAGSGAATGGAAGSGAARAGGDANTNGAATIGSSNSGAQAASAEPPSTGRAVAELSPAPGPTKSARVVQLVRKKTSDEKALDDNKQQQPKPDDSPDDEPPPSPAPASPAGGAKKPGARPMLKRIK